MGLLPPQSHLDPCQRATDTCPHAHRPGVAQPCHLVTQSVQMQIHRAVDTGPSWLAHSHALFRARLLWDLGKLFPNQAFQPSCPSSSREGHPGANVSLSEFKSTAPPGNPVSGCVGTMQVSIHPISMMSALPLEREPRGCITRAPSPQHRYLRRGIC